MKKKILVVIDMQKDFINGSLGTKEAVAIVPQVINKIKEYKKNNDIIVLTQDTHNENYLNTNEGKHLPIKHCIENTDGWEIYEDIKNELYNYNYKIYKKNTFGSLSLINGISNILSWDKYELEIELVGLCTDICVVSNALLIKANFPEIKITVDSSCCAGVTPQTHLQALNTMKMCQIDIL